MPQLDFHTFLPQVVWLLISFTALYLIMWRVAVPRIANVLEARQKRMEDNLEKAQELKREAEETLAAYEQAMAEARTKAQALLAKASQQLSEEATEREEKLAESLSKRIAESEAGIDKAIRNAMENVQEVAVEVAGAALQRLTGEKAPEKEVSEAVDQAFKAGGSA
ncbi:MAG: F0F1 ATP synthase subunit B' [Rhodospirillales bacterium]|nr:F0F1 ATP synthase subunit B' [Rhodospirillales bacterium]